MAQSTQQPQLRLKRFATKCQASICEKALLIAVTAHETCDALLAAYELVRRQRGRPRGMTTDSEQDLLRSMLVMAASGLDSTVKQLVQDALPHLIAKDAKSQNSFEKFVGRRLTAELTSVAGTANPKLLAAVLAANRPQARLIEEYVSHLTGGSLQSTDSLFEVAAALGAEPNAIGLVPGELKQIFDTRNKIIHELDINLNARKRTRNVRSQTTMISDTERLFTLMHALLSSVDARCR